MTVESQARGGMLAHPITVFSWGGYRELMAREPAVDAARMALWRIGTLLVVLGGFVSLTSAGRLVLGHVGWTIVFWSFVPVLQSAAVLAAVHVAAPREPRLRAISLYHAGQGPWLLWLCAVSGLCVLVPWLFRPQHIALLVRLIGGSLLVAFIWGAGLTHALFRVALGLPRRRALLATSVFYLVYVGAVVGYYLATNQILPQLGFGG